VADVVERKSSISRSARQKALNKISAKHFDFLLCDKDDLSVACAIELDDGSHNFKRRQERDDFLKGLCEAAGFPLIRIIEILILIFMPEFYVYTYYSTTWISV
jgi:hypothetical protein